MSYNFSDNIQRGILFLAKSDKDFFINSSDLVKEDYFEYPSHSNIFRVIKDHYEKYNNLPNDDIILESVKPFKGERELLSDYSDELSYINNLDTSSIQNKEFILDKVEDFAKKEAMKRAIHKSLELIKRGDVAAVETVVREALLVNRNVNVGQEYFDDFSDRWKRVFDREEQERYRTLLPDLDKSLEGGLGPKELAMVVAPPGVGKSLWLVNQACMGLTEGRNVLYISLEMREDKVAQRFDSIITGYNQGKLKEVSSQLQVQDRLQVFQDKFNAKLVIKEFPTATANVNTLRALLVQLQNHSDFVPDLIVVDYLELLRPTTEVQQEYHAQQRISEELRGLAMEHNCLLWTATQTNRQGRMVKIITDAELGDSYGKIRTCDFAISLNQTTEEFDNGQMRAFVIKSRNGRPRFIVPMNVDYGNLRMGQADYANGED